MTIYQALEYRSEWYLTTNSGKYNNTYELYTVMLYHLCEPDKQIKMQTLTQF
jgi:hypothetical protein